MTIVLDTVTAVCVGLMIGVEFSVSAFINPILNRLDDRARMNATQLFARKLGGVMPYWYSVSLLLLIASAVIHRHDSGLRLLIVAGALWIATIVHTVLVLVPINNRIIRLDSDNFSPEAQREQHR
jgi:uncharacterized membrane protein